MALKKLRLIKAVGMSCFALACAGAWAQVPVNPTALRAEAAKIAGDDLKADYLAQCEPVARPRGPRPAGPPPARARVIIEPTQVFDNLYYFGDSFVGATVLKTSAGLILIDTLTTSEDAANMLVPGMRKFELDPHDIRYVIVTHGHGDHHGGVQYLRQNFPGFKVVMTEADWAFSAKPLIMPGGRVDPAPKPVRQPGDIGYNGSFKVTLGDTTVSLVETPGHTPGTQSLLYPVRWHGKPLTVMQWGGGQPEAPQFTQEEVDSFFAKAKAAHASVRWWSHNYPNTRAKLAQLHAGAKENPFIYGEQRFARYLDVISLCKRAGGISAQSD
ncbi:MBL fold metallo-hydrolase [Novosphingobium sp. PP1Y]|uniref:MBL fold metallo-hydrolase n=1 Tax=Novosphingobium sp. PP1Y TaxID=702113 RepID=UPI00020EFB46|nr:MBL fold metallo-hydrolase [Novosphingobium sp. PP1Y]CCA90036.1 beta-lactamase domain protein [Novosphingobium sp. PP1Y]